jgi:hypothetical protein
MAEVDLNSVASSGVDPITGSPLSKEVRQAIFNKTRISGTAFNRDSFISQYVNDNKQKLELIQTNQESLIGVNTQINNLNQQIVTLNAGLTTIAQLLEKDAAGDQARLNADLEKNRRYTEQEVRVGKENEIENRIQAALVVPVQKLAPKVTNMFENIKRSLLFLFTGWLTNEIVKYFDAQNEGDTDKLTEIKNNILQKLGIAGGVLFAINGGIGLAIKLIVGLTGKILSLIGKVITAPFVSGINAIRRLVGGNKKPVPSSSASPKSSSTPKPTSGFFSKATSIASNAFTLAAGGIDFLGRKSEGQTNLQAGAGSVSSMAASSTAMKVTSKLPLPGIVKFPLTIGAGMLGWGMGGKLSDTMTGANNTEKSEPSTTSTAANSTTTTSNPPNPTSKPSTTSTAANSTTTTSNPPNPTSNTVTPVTPPLSTPLIKSQSSQPSQETKIEPQENLMKSQPSLVIPEEKVKQYERAWQYKDNPLARGKIESAWSKMSDDDKQQAKQWAESKGYDWSKMRLEEPKVTTQTKEPEISAVTKEVPKIDVLPEPKPDVIVAQQPQPKQQVSTQSQPNYDESVTDVPLIKSSNPDNFYILYSLLNYNVVI